MMPHQKRRRFIALLLAALLATGIAAYLMNRWLGDQPVEATAATRLSEQFALNTQSMQEQLAQSVAGRTTSATQERLDSPLGQALFRKCAEWTDFYENHAEEMARVNRDTACNEFRDYVDTGVVPDKP